MTKLTRWTLAEERIVREGLHSTPGELLPHLPDRTRAAVDSKLKIMRMSSGHEVIAAATLDPDAEPVAGLWWGKRKGERDDLAAWRVRTPVAEDAASG